MSDRNRSTDILFSKVVRMRGFCQKCGGIGPFECAHIIRRRFLRTRWLDDNAWCLCHYCHRSVDSDAHEFNILVELTIGWPKYDELRLMAHNMETPRPDRVQIRKQLRERLNELEAAA